MTSAPTPLLLPLAALFVAFFVAPLIVLVALSLNADMATATWTAANYVKFFTDRFNYSILWDTLFLGVKATLVCLVFGYPIAWICARASARWQSVLVFLVILPILTSVVVRTFAWIVILGRQGVLNQVALSLGLAREPLRLLYTEPGVVMVLAQVQMPLMVLCDVLFMSPLLLPALAFGFAALIFIHKLGFAPSIPFLMLGHTVVCVPFVLRTTIAALSQLDPALLDASQSLGAGGWMTFRRVTLPLIAPGLGAGAFLAFMASFDNVPVSLFLADERSEMLPIHLWQQIETNLDVRTAAVSGLIVIFTLILMLLAERLAGLTRQMR